MRRINANRNVEIRYDVVVLGAGPAGAALAIACLSRSLSVLILEPSDFPRSAPGETLHPGVESVLAHLGVRDGVLDTVTIRPEGQLVEWGAAPRLQRYGGPSSHPWRGYQVSRADLDRALVHRARTLGAEVWQPCRPERVLIENGQLCGLTTTRGEIRARWVVDATGRDAWLVRRLKLEVMRYSPALVSAYGYVEADSGSCDEPHLIADRDGWTWQARISPTAEAWVRTTPAAAHPARHWVPPSLRARRVLQAARFADVGWRLVAEPMGPGYAVVGDAGALLDPARSSGVLKAMVSGITAGACLTSVVADGADPSKAMAAYTRYVHDAFAADARALSDSYSMFRWWRPPETRSGRGEKAWHSSMT